MKKKYTYDFIDINLLKKVNEFGHKIFLEKTFRDLDMCEYKSYIALVSSINALLSSGYKVIIENKDNKYTFQQGKGYKKE